MLLSMNSDHLLSLIVRHNDCGFDSCRVARQIACSCRQRVGTSLPCTQALRAKLDSTRSKAATSDHNVWIIGVGRLATGPGDIE